MAAMAALRSHWPDKWAPPGSDGPPPAELLAQLEEDMLSLQRQLGKGADSKQNIDGNPWNQEQTMDKGVEVWGSKSVRSSARIFRIKAKVPKHGPEAVCTHLIVIENKQKWDTESISWARRLRCFTGAQPRDKVDIEVYTSHPAVGGLVKPRAFADARLTRFNADGSVTSVVRAVEGELLKQFDLPEFERLVKAAGLQRARNLSGGCGVRILPAPGGGSRFQMMAHTELGGWLPQGTINSATGAILGNMSIGLIKLMAKMPAEVAPATAAPPADAAAPPAAAAAAPERQRRKLRIRVPGSRDSERYSWRWG